MRFLTLLFLVSIVLACTVPLSSFQVKSFLADLFSKLTSKSDDDPNTQSGLRQKHLALFLLKVKDIIDYAKAVHEFALKTRNETRLKLNDLKTNGTKELIETVKEQFKGYWNKIWDFLDRQKSILPADKDAIKAELETKFKGLFDEFLEKVKGAVGNGEVLPEDNLVKILKEILDKFLNLKVSIKSKEFLSLLKEKLKDNWMKILGQIVGVGE